MRSSRPIISFGGSIAAAAGTVISVWTAPQKGRIVGVDLSAQMQAASTDQAIVYVLPGSGFTSSTLSFQNAIASLLMSTTANGTGLVSTNLSKYTPSDYFLPAGGSVSISMTVTTNSGSLLWIIQFRPD